MKDRLTELRTLLEGMEADCGRLIGLLNQERQALTNLETPRLLVLIQEKESLAQALQDGRDRVRTLVRDLAAEVCQEQVETISQLLPLLPSGERESLGRCYLRFRAKARDMETRNTANGLLAEEALKAFQGLQVEMAPGRGGTYDLPGRPQRPQAARSLRLNAEA